MVSGPLRSGCARLRARRMLAAGSGKRMERIERDPTVDPTNVNNHLIFNQMLYS